MASFGQDIKKSLKTLEDSAEMEINSTEKLKPDLKSAWNSESIPGRPTRSIDHEHYLQYIEEDNVLQNMSIINLSKGHDCFFKDQTRFFFQL